MRTPSFLSQANRDAILDHTSHVRSAMVPIPVTTVNSKLLERSATANVGTKASHSMLSFGETHCSPSVNTDCTTSAVMTASGTCFRNFIAYAGSLSLLRKTSGNVLGIKVTTAVPIKIHKNDSLIFIVPSPPPRSLQRQPLP